MVKLSKSELFNYFYIPICLLALFIYFIIDLYDQELSLYQQLNSNSIFRFYFYALVLLIFAILSKVYRLRYQTINQILSPSQFEHLCDALCSKFDWSIQEKSSSHLIAIGEGGFGIRIIIKHKSDKVLATSFCDPSIRSSLFSLGKNFIHLRTIHDFAKRIRLGEKFHLIKRTNNFWDSNEASTLNMIKRIIMYLICIILIYSSVYILIPIGGYIELFLGVFGIIFSLLYLIYDIKKIRSFYS